MIFNPFECLRRIYGLSIDEMAEKLGVSPSTVRQAEAGEVKMPHAMLSALELREFQRRHILSLYQEWLEDRRRIDTIIECMESLPKWAREKTSEA